MTERREIVGTKMPPQARLRGIMFVNQSFAMLKIVSIIVGYL